VVHATAAAGPRGGGGGLRVTVGGVAVAIGRGVSHKPRVAAAEELEVVELIAEAQHPVLAQRLVELHARHRQ